LGKKKEAPRLHGLLLVDKPGGMTSHDLVSLVRKAASQKEVGHLGTLDPLATGLMGILLGSATKLAPYLLCASKRYVAEIVLGLLTDTLDVTGETLEDATSSAMGLSASDVSSALAALTGRHSQAPPAFSAIKVGGVASHRLARRGEAVELASRELTAHSLELVTYSPPVATVEAHVSSGYYIRSLARDLGISLGLPGGALKALRRVSLGRWGIEGALRPPLGTRALTEALIGPREVLKYLPEYLASKESEEVIRRGGFLRGDLLDPARLVLAEEPDDASCAPDDTLSGSTDSTPSGSPDETSSVAADSTPSGFPGGPIKIVSPEGLLIAIGEFGETVHDDSSGPPVRAGVAPPGPFLRPRRVFLSPA
jgi:tRNA pseudouridine55 synthase